MYFAASGLPPFFSPKYDLQNGIRTTVIQRRPINSNARPRQARAPPQGRGLNEACTMYEVAVPDGALTEKDEDILNYDDIDESRRPLHKASETKCPEVRNLPPVWAAFCYREIP